MHAGIENISKRVFVKIIIKNVAKEKYSSVGSRIMASQTFTRHQRPVIVHPCVEESVGPL